MRLDVGLASILALLVGPAIVEASPPSETPLVPVDHGPLRGRLRVSGGRTPLADIKVLVVAAPPDATPGRPARDPLDPATVGWILEVQTDEAGRFELADVPVGKVRIVVVAAGYVRLEQFAEVNGLDAKELQLFVEPNDPASFRTEVVSTRARHEARPASALDAERGRVYPGSGSDPIRAAQNLPGMARSPGGVGLVAIRGGDPTQTGIYLDGHPIPRAFHVVPIASVVSPGMTDRVELTAGNYDAAFGGYSGGLVQIHTKSAIAGPLAGLGPRAIHGEAHIDLFDFGGTVVGPVGQGGVTFGFRRGHVGEVVRGVNRALEGQGSSIWVPNYWDYLGRFDHPVRGGHMLTVQALGAGDSLKDQTEVAKGPAGDSLLDFATGFHRFDARWTLTRSRFRVSVSPSIRLDSGRLIQLYDRYRRDTRVFSLRANVGYELSRVATLIVGVDVVRESWRRRYESWTGTDTMFVPLEDLESDGVDTAVGLWWGTDLHVDTPGGGIVVRPQVRLNMFSDGHEMLAMVDPRLDLRWRPHERVQLLAAVGQYSALMPFGGGRSVGLIQPVTGIGNAVVDVPDYLITYFDPSIDGDALPGRLVVSRTLHASLGAGVELPWKLRLQATGWWREGLPERRFIAPESQTGEIVARFVDVPQTRAYGLELLLDRPLARDIHGWLGYSVLRSQTRSDPTGSRFEPAETSRWYPTTFDQRHNFIALISAGLPRGFRLGLRFRVVSGNPEAAVIGAEGVQTPYGVGFRPIRSEFGDSYRPVFHQLDLRIDKTWHRRRASLTGYLDIQNVYNRWYPEVYVYSADWRDRSQVIGLPIFPSLGIRIDY